MDSGLFAFFFLLDYIYDSLILLENKNNKILINEGVQWLTVCNRWCTFECLWTKLTFFCIISYLRSLPLTVKCCLYLELHQRTIILKYLVRHIPLIQKIIFTCLHKNHITFLNESGEALFFYLVYDKWKNPFITLHKQILNGLLCPWGLWVIYVIDLRTELIVSAYNYKALWYHRIMLQLLNLLQN